MGLNHWEWNSFYSLSEVHTFWPVVAESNIVDVGVTTGVEPFEPELTVKIIKYNHNTYT